MKQIGPVHNRQSIRLPEYDYSKPGAYFVTVCTYRRRCLLGEIIGEGVALSQYGEIVQQYWEEIPVHFPAISLDVFIIMPNHIHGIITISEKRLLPGVGAQHAVPLPRIQDYQDVVPHSLPVIVRALKSTVTKHIHEKTHMLGVPFWQRGYYEHVIRNDRDLNIVRDYITTNPLRWSLDRENPEHIGLSPVEKVLFA